MFIYLLTNIFVGDDNDADLVLVVIDVEIKEILVKKYQLISRLWHPNEQILKPKSQY